MGLLVTAFAVLFAATMSAGAVVPVMFPANEADVAARKQQAEAGDAYAQADVASWYFSGDWGFPVNWREAAAWYEKAANQDHEGSQRRLAEMYEFGEGVPANHETALKWIRRALTKYSGASLLISGRYSGGQNAPKDARKALEWARISADVGDVDAQCTVGAIYEFGEGVQNYAEAAKWYRLAATREGLAPRVPSRAMAKMNLARLYVAGHGVPQSYDEAVKWYRLAIEEGNIDAQYGLGLLYERGHGVPQDSKRATELYYLAAPVHREARERLFLLYEKEMPLPADDAGAIAWYRAEAQKGHARAQAGLGLRYKFGRGVERDWGIAYALFYVASESAREPEDLPDFGVPRDVAEGHMSPAIWRMVDEMSVPGNFLTALDRYRRIGLAVPGEPSVH